MKRFFVAVVEVELTEMLVKHIEQSVGETPQEEQGCRQRESPQVWPSDEAVLERVAVGLTGDLVGKDKSSSSHVDSPSVGIEGKGVEGEGME